MIQRIQSIYLLLSGIITTVILFLNIVTFTSIEQTMNVTAFQLQRGTESQSIFALGGLFILSTILSFSTVFLYKNRGLQLRLCRLNIIILVMLELIIGLGAFYISKSFPADTVMTIGTGAYLPLICIILLVLAFKGIKKDILLIQSYDRIR